MTLSLMSMLALTACAGGDDAGCRLEKVAELPLTLVANVPVVTVGINGRPARLLLDTGSDASVLSRQAAARLGIAERPRPRPVGGAGGLVAVGMGRVDTLTLGSETSGADTLRNVPVVLANRPAPPLDGQLGIDVLVDYELDLDVPRRRAGLYRARSCASAMPAFEGRIVRLPAMQQEASGHMFVSLSVDGQPLRGLLDSGASASTLSLQAAEDVRVGRRELSRVPAVRAQSLNDSGLLTRAVRFRELRVGDDVLAHPSLTVADLPPFAGDVLVGEDYIGTRRIWFSFRVGRVFVEK